MTPPPSRALRALYLTELWIGGAGTALIAAGVAWLVLGFWLVPAFADSNIAGAVVFVLILVLLPCPLLLIVALGLRRRRRWARFVNLVFHPIFGLIYGTLLVPVRPYVLALSAALGLWAIVVLMRPDVKPEFARTGSDPKLGSDPGLGSDPDRGSYSRSSRS